MCCVINNSIFNNLFSKLYSTKREFNIFNYDQYLASIHNTNQNQEARTTKSEDTWKYTDGTDVILVL